MIPPLAPHAAMALGMIAVTLDPHATRRGVMLALAAAVAFAWLQRDRSALRDAYGGMQRRVMRSLPSGPLQDARLMDLDHTPSDYPRVKANVRVLACFSKLATLRKFNDHLFAHALSVAEYLLANGPSFTPHERVGLKDRVVNLMSQYTFVVPITYQRAMRFADKLMALDTTLFVECVRPGSRAVDVLPAPNGGAANGSMLYAGRDG